MPQPVSLGSLANMIETDDTMSVIQAHDKYGFKINGIHMRGSVIVFKNYTLLWDVSRVEDIGPRQAAAVHMLRPKVDLLIIGTGEHTRNINPSLYAYFARKGVSVEVMSTMHAVSTFNTLNQEGRRVAAALISREPLEREDCCFYTPELVETTADKRLKRALARDLTMQELQGHLLEAPEGNREVQDFADEEEAKLAALRRAGVAPDSAPIVLPGTEACGPVPGAPDLPKPRVVSTRSPSSGKTKTHVEMDVAYGYPGALGPDVPIVDVDTAARIAARKARPETLDDLDAARANRVNRRSFGKK